LFYPTGCVICSQTDTHPVSPIILNTNPDKSGFDSNVQVKVYDVFGREVFTLVDERQSAGVHRVEFNKAGLNGVYFYKLIADGFVQIKNMPMTENPSLKRTE
jgi:hypothetical protein